MDFAAVGVLLAAALGTAIVGAGVLHRHRRRAASPPSARPDRARRLRPVEVPRDAASDDPLSRRRADYLVTLAHELRTPLNAIDGFASLMARNADEAGPAAAADRRAAAGFIAEGARHLAGLIDDILAMARAEAGHLPVRIQEIDVAREVRAAVAMLAPLAADGGIELTASIDGEHRFGSDPRRLREVVLNLVGNAIKFTPAGGRVSVELAASRDATTVLIVADTGPGMTAEELRTVFEPWVRGARDAGRGSGLGLPLTKRIVDALGGVLTIRSGIGRGTVVTVRLPRREAGRDIAA